MRLPVVTISAVLLACSVFAAEKYTGPRPPKADVPYLMHADNLVETEAGEAKEDTRKDTTVASVSGESSTAKTPLAEPIFIIKTNKLRADRIAAYKMSIKNGSREVTVNHKNAKNVSKPIHLVVTRLEDGLYKIEVDEPLENGEYTLSPDGSNETFSFAIY